MKSLIILLIVFTSNLFAQVGPVRWRVDASIYGANPALSSGNVTSYTGIEDAGLTLVNNSGTGTKVITAQIPCSSTNAPSGTTCTTGNESVGIAFTPPGGWKGDVMACVSFSHRLLTYGGSNFGELRTTFQIVETPANAQTISQEGKSKVQSGVDSTNVSHFLEYHTFPYRLCGNFTFSTSGQKVLRLFYEQSFVTSAGPITLLADRDANRGQPDIRWEVYPLNN